MSVLANVWSFVLTLVRSLVALFSLRRRAASDPFSLPSVNRTPNDALARAHSRLRPILLTPRSVALSPAYSPSPRTHSAPSAPQASEPQRTSPKLDPHDAELGLPAASATSSREYTPDTSGTGSLYVLPLTPPDRCYMPSPTDCPYTESWPTDVLDHVKPRLPGSPLKLSVNTELPFPEPMVAPIGSPPPGRWSPVHVWTSTPCKSDSPVPDSFDQHKDPSSALANLSHAIISRSQSSLRPYDDASNSSISLDASPFVNYANGPTYERHRTQALVPRSKDQLFPRFHHPDAYTCTWRRLPARLPGRLDPNAYARSHSHSDLPANEWYNAEAYAPSPHAMLSPPRSESATDDEDEEEMPLGRLRERLARRSLGVLMPNDPGMRKALAISPRTRRMSDGCLLALSEGTPTRVGVGARTGRQAFSMALDDDVHGAKDWLEALSLRLPSEHEQRDAAEPSADVVVV